MLLDPHNPLEEGRTVGEAYAKHVAKQLQIPFAKGN